MSSTCQPPRSGSYLRALIFAALSLCAQTAAAEEARLSPEDQRAYDAAVDAGVQDFSAGNYSEARSMFHRAYDIDPNARVLRGLAGTEFELRNYVRCLEYIEAALASQRKPLTPAMREDMQQLEDRARTYVALATFKVSPRPASVTVDGVERELPASGNLFLEVGKHEVVVRAAGYKPLVANLDLVGGQPRTVAGSLVPLKPLDDAPTVNHDDSDSRRRRRWIWALTAAAVVVGAGVGVGVGLARRSGGDATVAGGSSGVVIPLD